MKKIVQIVFILLTINCFSQTAKAEYGSKIFSSTGVFTNNVNEAVGYYNIGRSSKKNEDKSYNYKLTIRDNNFNPIAEKVIPFSKWSLYIDSAFNGEYIALCFYDMKKGEYSVKIFDKESNLYLDETISYKTKKEINKTQKQIYLGGFAESIDFIGLKNQGFLLTYPGDYGVARNGFTTKAALINTEKEATKRNITIPIKRKHFDKNTILRLEFLASNKKNVVLKKLDNHYSIDIFDATNGNLKFSTKEKELDSVYINKAFFKDSGNLVVVGNYYKDEKGRQKNESLGFFYQELTPDGKVVKLHKNNWKTVLSKFSNIKENNKLKDVGYLYLHNVLEHNDGFLAVFETYKLTKGAKKILLSNSSIGNKQLTTNDAFIFNFDKDFNTKNIKRVDKQISRWQGANSIYTERYNAERAAKFGGFDYLYHQKDVNRNRFYFYFYDYERKKQAKNGFAIKTTIFENGEFFEDKLTISSKSSEHKVLPAEIGEILILEYFKKDKKFNIRKERFSLD